MSNEATFRTLLEEVASCFTRDDDLPNELLVRIDKALNAAEPECMRIMHFPSLKVPMEAFRAHEQQALKNHNQSLDTLNARGGVSLTEALAILQDKRFGEVQSRYLGTSVFAQYHELIKTLKDQGFTGYREL